MFFTLALLLKSQLKLIKLMNGYCSHPSLFVLSPFEFNIPSFLCIIQYIQCNGESTSRAVNAEGCVFLLYYEIEFQKRTRLWGQSLNVLFMLRGIVLVSAALHTSPPNQFPGES